MNETALGLSGPSLQQMFHRMFEIQPRLPAGTALTIGIAALITVMFPVTWSFVRYFGTMAHEGSHAVVGSLTGQKITGIELNLNGATGGTDLLGPGPKILAGIAGYLGPSAFGLGAAKLISAGHSDAVLWLSLGLLFLLLAQIRNIIGILLIVVAGYVIFIFARYGTISRQTMAAYGIAWLLLLSGVRWVLLHWDKARDGKILQGTTGSEPVVFARIWLVGTLFALFLGTRLLM